MLHAKYWLKKKEKCLEDEQSATVKDLFVLPKGVKWGEHLPDFGDEDDPMSPEDRELNDQLFGNYEDDLLSDDYDHIDPSEEDGEGEIDRDYYKHI